MKISFITWCDQTRQLFFSQHLKSYFTQISTNWLEEMSVTNKTALRCFQLWEFQVIFFFIPHNRDSSTVSVLHSHKPDCYATTEWLKQLDRSCRFTMKHMIQFLMADGQCANIFSSPHLGSKTLLRYVASKVKIPREKVWLSRPPVGHTVCRLCHLCKCKLFVKIGASCVGSFPLEDPLGIHSLIVVGLWRDTTCCIEEKFAKELQTTILLLYWWNECGLTNLHKFSSYQSSGGGQDVVVVFPGEFASQHFTLQLPGSLF